MAIMIGNNNNNNNHFDAFSSLSFINRGRMVAQREVQRTSTTRLDINDAIDNVSAYSIEESLRIRTRVLNQVNQNIQDDTALLKTARSRGGAIVDSIKEIQRLAISATDEAITDDDRRVIQKDINRLVDQIVEDSQITFNGRKLIDGSATTGNPALATVLSNSSLYSGTTADTALTELKNSNGANLGIDASDRITASYVKDGNIYTTNFSVGNNTLEDIFVNLNKITGMTLRETTFVGGGRGILVEPVEPPAPIRPPEPIEPTKLAAPLAPTAPTIVAKPEIPRGFVPDNEPEMTNFASADEYNAATAIYSAVQSGTAKIIEEDDPNYATAFADYSAKTFQERTTEITAYNQYLNKMDIYDSAMEDYNAAKEKYDAYIANNPESAEVNSAPTSSIATYNWYVNRKDSYDSARANFNSKYEQFANYVANAPDHSEAYENYSAYLTNESISINEERTRIVADYNQYLSQYNNNSTEDDYHAAYEKYSAYIDAYSGLVEQYNRELEEYNRLLPQYQDYKRDYDENFLPQYQKDMADYRLMTANIVQSDNDNGMSVTARKPGLDEQISGVSINVTDSSGNAKSFANAALNNFKTTTYAADAREDNSVYFQIGETIDQVLNFGFTDMRAEAFGLKGANGNTISISTKEDADAALATINNALSKANEQVQMIGYSEKRLGYIADALSNEISNIQEPDLMVRNADRARTLTLYTLDFFQRDRMQSMLAIANQHSSAVMALLR